MPAAKSTLKYIYMKTYTFWNNKGGTGKTSLCFQSIVEYANQHQNERILVLDMCPQANLSELLAGGLVGNGGTKLSQLYIAQPYRKSIGGYFEYRIQATYNQQAIHPTPTDFISQPSRVNLYIPANVDLIAGDSIVELQASFISAIATQTMPMVDPYVQVLKWVIDLLTPVSEQYDVVFIDTNPSFSIYTQIALAATNFLIVPVMADDSSRRALSNVLSLVYGYNLPAPHYQSHNFNSRMISAGMALPQIHMVIKNRMTQYMGSARGYSAVLQSIDNEIAQMKQVSPQYFSANNVIMEVRDFQTAGVVAFAEARGFNSLLGDTRVRDICGNKVQVDGARLNLCLNDVNSLISNL